MALYSGLSVAVISGNDALPMYDDPEMEGDGNPDEDLRYIEATTGAKFEVQVTLDDRFIWAESNTVRVVVVYDGDKPGWSKDFSRKSLPTVGTWRHSITFKSVSRWCQSSQQWKSGYLSFGALEARENTEASVDVQRLGDLGSIKVTVQRVNVGSWQREKEYVGEGYQRVAEVSEKMLKGKAISNAVACVDQRPCPRPNEATFATPLPGDLGKSYTTKIIYRSRRTLQMLGCIPRTPSPESEDVDKEAVVPGSTDNHNTRKTEIQNLRARLALLERDPNVKPETSNTINVKRERAETGVGNARKRSRRSGSIEVVDLTGD